MTESEIVTERNSVPASIPDVSNLELTPVRRDSGGSIQTQLSRTNILNEHSSLTREWITIDDETLPARILGVAGVTTRWDRGSDYQAAGYYYWSEYGIKTAEQLSALETRFLTFDIWGEHVRTLSSTQIMDLMAGETRHITSRWNIYGDNETSEMYASIAFIAQVRTTAGRVLRADMEPVLSEAKKFSASFEESGLTPSSPKR